MEGGGRMNVCPPVINNAFRGWEARMHMSVCAPVDIFWGRGVRNHAPVLLYSEDGYVCALRVSHPRTILTRGGGACAFSGEGCARANAPPLIYSGGGPRVRINVHPRSMYIYSGRGGGCTYQSTSELRRRMFVHFCFFPDFWRCV